MDNIISYEKINRKHKSIPKKNKPSIKVTQTILGGAVLSVQEVLTKFLYFLLYKIGQDFLDRQYLKYKAKYLGDRGQASFGAYIYRY